ncbi:MAG TPA: hypothetical protein VFC78_20395 [Tepidisphaeraceae bacterium]|nr:hypothetical protein [Tepidisphaeraceae bacterium]
MLADVAILDRVLNSQRGNLSPELARHILSLDFPPVDHARYAALSDKAQAGTLAPSERAELEDYLNVNDLLLIMKAKAQASLRQQNPAA